MHDKGAAICQVSGVKDRFLAVTLALTIDGPSVSGDF
jgi:hypothetical protein